MVTQSLFLLRTLFLEEERLKKMKIQRDLSETVFLSQRGEAQGLISSKSRFFSHKR